MARYEGRDIEISTDINIPKTIYKKIGEAVDLDIEGLGVRPFRELLQNADDARATTLTMRFDKDMLLVHNDGYTIEHRFVEAMSKGVTSRAFATFTSAPAPIRYVAVSRSSQCAAQCRAVAPSA